MLSATCKTLHQELGREAVWKQSYIYRFFGRVSDGVQVKREVEVLVQSCAGVGGRGWKKEALSREAVLE